tara:strand:- start:48 stop:1445 length:1398 start_codon:yes stop_codon:yes gene_type:complete
MQAETEGLLPPLTFDRLSLAGGRGMVAPVGAPTGTAESEDAWWITIRFNELTASIGRAWSDLNALTERYVSFEVVRTTVRTLSIVLLAWSVFAFWPRFAPYDRSVGIELTLLAWRTAVWSVGLVVAILLSFCVGLRGLSTSLRRFGIVSIGAFALVWLYAIPGLNMRQFQDAWNGRLKRCTRFCPNVFEACVHEPTWTVANSLSQADVAARSVVWLEANVHGYAPAISTTAGGTTLALDWGGGCTTQVTIPAGPVDALLTLDTLDAAEVATRHGLQLVELFASFPTSSACEAVFEAAHGGRFAREARFLNEVAAAIVAADASSTVSLYGCSFRGRVAQWAAVTASGFSYATVFVDSGGTLGIASVKSVSACGESFEAMVARWPSWLASNASLVEDVSTWPPDVDAYVPWLTTCASTRLVVSVSALDLWNNPGGTQLAIDELRLGGCSNVELTVSEASGTLHCGLL